MPPSAVNKPKVVSDISIGSIVSWSLILVAVIVAFVKLQEVSAQNSKDVVIAQDAAMKAADLARLAKETAAGSDSEINARVASLSTDVAVIRSEIKAMHSDLGDKFNVIIDNQKAILSATKSP